MWFPSQAPTSSECTILPVEPRFQDVLLHHSFDGQPGNLWFRAILRENRNTYLTSSSVAKAVILEAIVEFVTKQSNSRMLLPRVSSKDVKWFSQPARPLIQIMLLEKKDDVPSENKLLSETLYPSAQATNAISFIMNDPSNCKTHVVVRTYPPPLSSTGQFTVKDFPAMGGGLAAQQQTPGSPPHNGRETGIVELSSPSTPPTRAMESCQSPASTAEALVTPIATSDGSGTTLLRGRQQERNQTLMVEEPGFPVQVTPPVSPLNLAMNLTTSLQQVLATLPLNQLLLLEGLQKESSLGFPSTTLGVPSEEMKAHGSLLNSLPTLYQAPEIETTKTQAIHTTVVPPMTGTQAVSLPTTQPVQEEEKDSTKVSPRTLEQKEDSAAVSLLETFEHVAAVTSPSAMLTVGESASRNGFSAEAQQPTTEQNHSASASTPQTFEGTQTNPILLDCSTDVEGTNADPAILLDECSTTSSEAEKTSMVHEINWQRQPLKKKRKFGLIEWANPTCRLGTVPPTTKAIVRATSFDVHKERDPSASIEVIANNSAGEIVDSSSNKESAISKQSDAVLCLGKALCRICEPEISAKINDAPHSCMIHPEVPFQSTYAINAVLAHVQESHPHWPLWNAINSGEPRESVFPATVQALHRALSQSALASPHRLGDTYRNSVIMRKAILGRVGIAEAYARWGDTQLDRMDDIMTQETVQLIKAYGSKMARAIKENWESLETMTDQQRLDLYNDHFHVPFCIEKFRETGLFAHTFHKVPKGE